MRVVAFYHSLLSDWNHGNAHFLRGVASEFIARGHSFHVYEPENAWSVQNLLRDYGEGPLRDFQARYPLLQGTRYNPGSLDLSAALHGADLVLVHEWNDHDLVRRIGEHHRAHPTHQLLFHDTHHRAVTDPVAMRAYDLSGYHGVLAFGNAIRDLYTDTRAWTWHEAADIRVFHPIPGTPKTGDLVWVGNWGDDERTEELDEFLIGPVRDLGLKAKVYGVRYPQEAIAKLRSAGIEYGGWLPNFQAPGVFAQYRVTVHVPRRPYVQALRGIPTIRPFEALACGIPLISAPWDDAEGLFTPGEDFLVARDRAEMKRHLQAVLGGPELACRLARHGLQTILQRHTCAHRVDELLAIVN